MNQAKKEYIKEELDSLNSYSESKVNEIIYFLNSIEKKRKKKERSELINIVKIHIGFLKTNIKLYSNEIIQEIK